VDLLGSEHRVPDHDGAVSIPLDPYGYGWYRLRYAGQRVAP
jgi:hypothetical protein